jgi:hypothetical protein
MARMPVATLRVWERRYGLAAPALGPSGQRLYTAADVRRIALLKQLVDLGHAIGGLASLDMVALHEVAATHASALASAQVGASAGRTATSAAASRAASPRPAPGDAIARAWRVAVCGPALAARLRRPALLRGLDRPLQLIAVHDRVEDLAADPACARADAWLADLPTLPDTALAALAARPRGRAAPARAVGVLYGFAPQAACERWAAAGLTLLRAPQPDAALGPWLRGLLRAAGDDAAGSPAVARSPALSRSTPTAMEPPACVPPRRWDDAALADVAGLSTTVACECPRHVAELLVQLSHFEDYSAQCASRGPADAALHAYLGRVAATSRALFETALERLALHEGLLLP